jgi:hypothetical protein
MEPFWSAYSCQVNPFEHSGIGKYLDQVLILVLVSH